MAMAMDESGARILVVDDEAQVRATVRQMLESGGYKALAARSAEECLAFLEAQPIDLVITDILMPQKEGVELIVEIRRQRASLPIIAISGGGRTGKVDLLQIAQSLGASLILQKPFRSEQLLSAIASALAGRAPVR